MIFFFQIGGAFATTAMPTSPGSVIYLLWCQTCPFIDHHDDLNDTLIDVKVYFFNLRILDSRKIAITKVNCLLEDLKCL